MQIHQYKNYDEYVEIQTRTNKEKLDWVYAKKDVIEQICNHKKIANNIICHGTRNGAEQNYFKEFFPDAYIIGTEISSTASEFPMTIQHDFTMQKSEWIEKFDVIYSNSFDHTIDPEKTITTWAEQLSNTGILYLEYADSQSIGNDADPLNATNEEIIELIERHMKIVGTITKGVKHGGTVFICERNVK